MKTENISEAEKFLKQNQGIEEFDLLLPDMNGVLRGKRIQRENLLSIYEKGLYLPVSVFGLDVTGETMEETGLGFKSGDMDYQCFPLEKTLNVVPWQKARGQLFLKMFGQDGVPFYGNPREVLKSLCNRMTDAGLKAVVAVEMEFFLTDLKKHPWQSPRPARSTESGQRENEGLLYSLASLDDHNSFFQEISAVAEKQNIPIYTALSELSPGQFEINLHHVPDVLAACDQAVMLKRIIRSIANMHKMEATFMPKIFPDQPGNGMHVHLSLLNSKGKNVFQGSDSSGSPELRYAVEGLRKVMVESMLICAPHANSYHRFQDDSCAPVNMSWGYNNRTVSIRIPPSEGPDTRIEHRLAGADANPYLLIASLLCGILQGLNQKKEPPPPEDGNSYLQTDSELPRTWEEARNKFEQAEILPKFFGRDFCDLFANLKKGEQYRFLSRIAPLEYEWYLRTV